MDRTAFAAALDGSRLEFIGAGATTDNYVTRAVFTLGGDIGAALPHLHRAIPGSSYSPATQILAFRLWNMPVVMKPETITVNKMADGATARRFLDWLKAKTGEAG